MLSLTFIFKSWSALLSLFANMCNLNTFWLMSFDNVLIGDIMLNKINAIKNKGTNKYIFFDIKKPAFQTNDWQVLMFLFAFNFATLVYRCANVNIFSIVF